MDIAQTASELLDEAKAIALDAVEGGKRLAASEQGQQVRNIVATGLIVAVPAVLSTPALRRSRIGRWIELAGGTALVIALAEKIRDWNPDEKST